MFCTVDFVESGWDNFFFRLLSWAICWL